MKIPIVAVVIGFIVFEIVSRNLKPLIERWTPVVVEEISRRRKEHGWDAKAQTMVMVVREKGISIYSAVYAVVRNAIKKHFPK